MEVGYKKLYENALEAARQGKSIEEIFPELAESDDRQIRERLVQYLENRGRVGTDQEFIDCHVFLTWLEKQNRDGKKWIYEEEYQKDLDRLYEDGKDEVLNNPEKFGLQKKSKWSEEDEKIYNRIYDLIQAAAFTNLETDEVGNELGEYAKMTKWLKSFKPQPKQEQNDESEKTLRQLVSRLESMPKEQLEEKWKALEEEWGNVGPTVEEFLYGKSMKWSEESKQRIEGIIATLTGCVTRLSNIGNLDIEDIIAELQDDIFWFKSLKPQPKQGWSEEDKKISQAIYESIDFNILESLGVSEDDAVAWLNFPKPQPRQERDGEDEEMLNAINKNEEKYQRIKKELKGE